MSRVVLITGGTSGYGKAMAKAFTKYGDTVIIASHNKDNLLATHSEIGCADSYLLDVRSYDGWVGIKDYIVKKYGRLDILINNAGGGVAITEVAEHSKETIDQTINLNLSSVMYGSNVFAPLFREQHSGTIINVSSVCAKHAWKGWTVYASVKAGVLAFSKGLYLELQPYGVRVTCLIPAQASTGFQKSSGIGEVKADLTAEDIATAVMNICNLPDTAVVEEMTVWGIDQICDPL